MTRRRHDMVSDSWGSPAEEDIYLGDVSELDDEDAYSDFDRGYGGKPADASVPMFGEEADTVTSPSIAVTKRTRALGPRKRLPSRENLRVTERDVELFRFLGRYKYATVAQIARFFGTTERALAVRMPKLERAGLLFWEWGMNSRPKLWMATADALVFAQMELPVVKRIGWGHLRHTLALTDLGIGFELDGEVVITEREIRAAAVRKNRGFGLDGRGVGPTDRVGMAMDLLGDRAEDQVARSVGSPSLHVGSDGSTSSYVTTGEVVRFAYTVPKRSQAGVLGRGGAVGLGHVPDMVVLRQPAPSGASSNIAIELELTRKTTAEWTRVIQAYVAYGGYQQVYYYVTEKQIARQLVRVIASVPGGRGKVFVRLFEVIDKSADPTMFGRRAKPRRSPVVASPQPGLIVPVDPPPPQKPRLKAKVKPKSTVDVQPKPKAKARRSNRHLDRGSETTEPVVEPSATSQWEWDDAPVADPSSSSSESGDEWQ